VVRTFHVDVEYARTTFYQFNIALEPATVWVVLVVFLLTLHRFRDEWSPNDVVPRFRLSDVDPVDDGVDLAPLHFGVDSVGKEGIAGFVFEVHNAFFGVTGYLDTLDVFLVDDLLHESSGVGVEVLESHDIDFVDDEKGGFSVEEGLDGVEKFTLFLEIRLEKRGQEMTDNVLGLLQSTRTVH
jgi:hypothetical protein